MTIVPITPITSVPNVPYPFVPPPFTDVAPLTYRDGTTYLEYLKGLNDWIQNTLIPFINNNLTSLGQNYLDVANNLINTVNTALTNDQTIVNNALNTQATNVNDALTTQSASVTKQLADNLTAVNNAVQQVINTTITVSDPIIYGVINNKATQSAGVIQADIVANTSLIEVIPNTIVQANATIAAQFPTVTLAQVQAVNASATLSDSADWYVLQSFINACATNSTKTIKVPQGTYYMSRGLDLSALDYGAFVNFEGVILKAISSIDAMVKLQFNGNYWIGRRAVIQGLEIRGNYLTGVGISLNNVQEWSLSAVRVHECLVGIQLIDTYYGSIGPATDIQDCLVGLSLDVGTGVEINTINFDNLKINFDTSKTNFVGHTNDDAIGVRFAVIMGGVDFHQPVIEGYDYGFKYVPTQAGVGTYIGSFSLTRPYFEAIAIRYFDFSLAANAGMYLMKNDITVLGARFHDSGTITPSVFTTGRHRIIGCQPIKVQFLQSSPVNRIQATIDDNVTVIAPVPYASDPQVMINVVDAYPTLLNWQRYNAWGNTNSYPSGIGLPPTIATSNYMLASSPPGLRGEVQASSKWYDVFSVTTRPVVFYPALGEKNGPVIKGDDGSWYLLQVDRTGAVAAKKVVNINRIDESVWTKTAKELWYLANTAPLGSTYLCSDISTKVTLTAIDSGNRWMGSTGSTTLRIGKTAELITLVGSMNNGEQFYDVYTGQVTSIDSSHNPLAVDWYGNVYSYKTFDVAANRPATAFDGFVFYSTDTAAYSQFINGAYVAFTPNTL